MAGNDEFFVDKIEKENNKLYTLKSKRSSKSINYSSCSILFPLFQFRIPSPTQQPADLGTVFSEKRSTVTTNLIFPLIQNHTVLQYSGGSYFWPLPPLLLLLLLLSSSKLSVCSAAAPRGFSAEYLLKQKERGETHFFRSALYRCSSPW